MRRNIDILVNIPFMKTNKTYSLGGIIIIENVEKNFGIFSGIFRGIEGNTKDFISRIKLLVYNRLTHSVSVHQILNTYPIEVMEHLGMKKIPAERSLYRTLEKIGKNFPIILERYQKLIEKHGLVDNKQVIDFSSTYLEGNKSELGELGYSRDKILGKLQINFGISTGINDIPTAITIQKGNTQDKEHMRAILKVISKVIPKNSILIYDAGANTWTNKKKIKAIECNYLTRKQKNVKSYKKYIRYFREKFKACATEYFKINERDYYGVKAREGDEINYIFFCPQLYDEQIKKKERKFERQKEKGNKLLKKRKTEKIPSDMGWVELIPQLQKTLFAMDNPYINGLEGFFILECSVDAEIEKILRLYKARDKAEKFVRALKEGLELHPVRHWNKWSVIGLFFICFLTNFLINLTLFSKEKETDCADIEEKVTQKNAEKFDTFSEDKNKSTIKNVKLLKKYLITLCLTVVYPKSGFRFHILSNISPVVLKIFGDSIWRYEDKSLNLRW